MMESDQLAVVRQYRRLETLVPKHWHHHDLLLDDRTRIHYSRTGGAKPALLLLHGIQASGLTWLRTAETLEADYDVIMPDFRGHGQSGRVEHGFSTELLVSDTLALIRHLEVEQPCVVGHSMGADIAGRLAAVYPVRALVLVDPALQHFPYPVDMDSPPPWMEALFQTMRALKTQSHEDRLTTALKLLPPGSPIWAEADFVSYLDGQAQFDLDVYRYASSLGYLFDEPEVIQRIDCPILLMTARPMIPGASLGPGLAAFTANWRDGRHLHFEDSGHAIHFDQFARFIEALRHFLDEVRAG